MMNDDSSEGAVISQPGISIDRPVASVTALDCTKNINVFVLAYLGVNTKRSN